MASIPGTPHRQRKETSRRSSRVIALASCTGFELFANLPTLEAGFVAMSPSSTAAFKTDRRAQTISRRVFCENFGTATSFTSLVAFDNSARYCLISGRVISVRHFGPKRGVTCTRRVGLLRHRQTKGPVSARPHLNRRATPRLHLTNPLFGEGKAQGCEKA